VGKGERDAKCDSTSGSSYDEDVPPNVAAKLPRFHMRDDCGGIMPREKADISSGPMDWIIIRSKILHKRVVSGVFPFLNTPCPDASQAPTWCNLCGRVRPHTNC
jgi:hypothetical protein